MTCRNALLALAALLPLAAQEPLPMPRVSGFTVFDTTGQVEVGSLEEGGVVHMRHRRAGDTTNRSIVAAVEGVATSVDMRIDYVTADAIGRTYTDRTEPYTVCGDWDHGDERGVRIYGCPHFLTEGEAVLSATPWDGERKGTGLTVSFTIVRVSSTEPSAGSHSFSGGGGGGSSYSTPGVDANGNRVGADGRCYDASGTAVHCSDPPRPSGTCWLEVVPERGSRNRPAGGCGPDECEGSEVVFPPQTNPDGTQKQKLVCSACWTIMTQVPCSTQDTAHQGVVRP